MKLKQTKFACLWKLIAFLLKTFMKPVYMQLEYMDQIFLYNIPRM